MLLCRRITNRESARRMRKKRAEERNISQKEVRSLALGPNALRSPDCWHHMVEHLCASLLLPRMLLGGCVPHSACFAMPLPGALAPVLSIIVQHTALLPVNTGFRSKSPQHAVDSTAGFTTAARSTLRPSQLKLCPHPETPS